jgi:hypothetical protein
MYNTSVKLAKQVVSIVRSLYAACSVGHLAVKGYNDIVQYSVRLLAYFGTLTPVSAAIEGDHFASQRAALHFRALGINESARQQAGKK